MTRRTSRRGDSSWASSAPEIRRIVWEAVAGFCAATPGLRALKVVRDGAALRVDGMTGSFADVPPTLPATVLSVRVGQGTAGWETVHSSAERDVVAGTPCARACLRLPKKHERLGAAWLLLGSPGKIPAEALVSVGSLANLATLALRNNDVHQELTLQATLDGLTGLANRMSFNAALSATLDNESSRHTSVLFIDIDDFRGVNDRFGHGPGDDLLHEVGARLLRALAGMVLAGVAVREGLQAWRGESCGCGPTGSAGPETEQACGCEPGCTDTCCSPFGPNGK